MNLVAFLPVRIKQSLFGFIFTFSHTSHLGDIGHPNGEVEHSATDKPAVLEQRFSTVKSLSLQTSSFGSIFGLGKESSFRSCLSDITTLSKLNALFYFRKLFTGCFPLKNTIMLFYASTMFMNENNVNINTN